VTAGPSEPAGRPTRWMATLNWLCHGMLAAGLVMPCMTFVSRMGDATDIARAAGLIPDPKTYSVLSGILALFEDGDVLIGGVLLVFSVLFPVAKLIAVRLVLGCATRGAIPPGMLKAVTALSKYSMVDVFVIALLVVASKTMPGGSRIRPEWGLLAFGAAALLSMGLTSAVRRATTSAG